VRAAAVGEPPSRFRVCSGVPTLEIALGEMVDVETMLLRLAREPEDHFLVRRCLEGEPVRIRVRSKLLDFRTMPHGLRAWDVVPAVKEPEALDAVVHREAEYVLNDLRGVEVPEVSARPQATHGGTPESPARLAPTSSLSPSSLQHALQQSRGP
jgi:hypothetical protein